MHVQRLVGCCPEPRGHRVADLPEHAGPFDIGVGARCLARCELALERAARVLGRLLELLARPGLLLMLLALLLEATDRRIEGRGS